MITQMLPSFLLTALLVELTPGPNMAWLAMLSATQGRRSGLAATAGVGLGLAIVAAAAAFGIAQFAHGSPAIFAILRHAGAAFLFWLAWEAWTAADEVSPEPADQQNGAIQHFRRGLAINLLNPKAALFFVAVLPTFVVPDLAAGYQAATLSVIYVLVATAIHLAIVGFAGFAHHWTSDRANLCVVRRVFAILLCGVAIWFFASTTG